MKKMFVILIWLMGSSIFAEEPTYQEVYDGVVKTGTPIYIAVGEKPSWFDSQIGKEPSCVLSEVEGYKRGEVIRVYKRGNTVMGVTVLPKVTSLIVPDSFNRFSSSPTFGGCST